MSIKQQGLKLLSLKLLCFLCFLSACSSQFDALNIKNSTSLNSLIGNSEGCLPNAEVCLIAKGLPATNQQILNDGQIKNLQNYGVNLSSLLNSSQTLKTSQFTVVKTDQTSPTSNNWKTYSQESTQNLGHVSSIYYAQDLYNHLKDIDSSLLAISNIKIQVDSSMSGYFVKTNEIHLQKKSHKSSMSLDGSIIVNYASLGFAQQLSSFKLHSNILTQAQSCTNSKGSIQSGGCCRSINGCGPAIASAAADYFTTLYFTKKGWPTSFGQYWSDSAEGFSHCEISRDLSKQSGLKFNTAFSACQQRGSSGWYQTLGTTYASAWWLARSRSPTPQEIDQLFIRHLHNLSGADTFITALNKAKQLDVSYFGSRHSTLLDNIFREKGLL